MTDSNKNGKQLSELEFASLGDGFVAYIRPISADTAKKFIGPMYQIPENTRLYGLFSASGIPLSISDSRNSAIASAFENDLNPMRVH